MDFAFKADIASLAVTSLESHLHKTLLVNVGLGIDKVELCWGGFFAQMPPMALLSRVKKSQVKGCPKIDVLAAVHLCTQAKTKINRFCAFEGANVYIGLLLAITWLGQGTGFIVPML